MKTSTVCILALFVLAGAASIHAQFVPPPTIVVTSAERLVDAYVEADGEWDDNELISTAIGGPYAATAPNQLVGMEGSSSSGVAQQNTYISTYSIHGSGSVTANATLGGGENAQVFAASDSRLFTLFSVPVGTPYRLYGTLTASGDAGGTCLSGATVAFSTLHSHFVDCNTPVEQQDFFFCGVTVDASHAFAAEVNAYPSADGGMFDIPGQGTASFDFTLEFGTGSEEPSCDDLPPDPNDPPDPDFDNDYDGLIDGWEIDGIDFDGDGTPEIDLPGLGAIPGVRDLFVEIDVMDGILFDQTAVDDVVRAFAEAPVVNYNGQSGINLIVLVDTDQPAGAPLNLLANGNLPPEYYVIKDAFFGTAVNRSHPDWDQIRQVLLGIFRYCLWADTVVEDDGDRISGVAEGIPSNDFVVAGSVVSWFTDPVNATNGLAGTFMHELGHAIDLRHGGQENSPNFKPNYLSVMNYAYQLPFEEVTPQGTDAEDAWRLDFSRTSTRSLDENQLVESEGLDGPAGRMMLFNSAPQGSSSTINIAWANADTVDWNNNSTADGPPYPRDITNLQDDPASLDVLDSYEDWNQLWIEPAGGPNFDDRQPWPWAEPVLEGITQDSFLAIQNAEWVDQTALGDLVFENDFELGSTTAWSETVP